MAHQWIPFCVATPLQNASADILRYARQRDYYEHLRSDYQRRRDYLVEVLHKADLRPFVPEGTYFIIADTSAWDQPDDQQFCHYLTTQIGVVAIPPSHFYCEAHRHLASKHARFAFCKRDSVLQIADQRLTLHRS
jgi:N-succinyldiaminopimelate aminotransferase